MIPQSLMVEHDMHATYFCGDSLKASTIKCKHIHFFRYIFVFLLIAILAYNPGPLMVVFHSDAIYKQGESGFVFSYDVV